MDMQNLCETDKFELDSITANYVDELLFIWTQIFSHSTTKDYLKKLKEYVFEFYCDLVKNSKEHRNEIENDIVKLQKEEKTLYEQLQTEINLPSKNDNNLSLLEIQKQIDSNLEILRAKVKVKQNELLKLLQTQNTLCDDLDEKPITLQLDPLPTAQAIDSVRQNIERLKLECVKRNDRLIQLRRDIQSNLQILDLPVSNPIEKRLLEETNVKLNEHTLTTLENSSRRYATLVQEVQDQIENMRTKLEFLWNRLGTPFETRNKFRNCTKHTQCTFDMLYMEVKRCEALKRQNIKDYIQKLRTEISLWWDKTLQSEIQRSLFTKFKSNCYTDDLVELYKLELADLKCLYQNNARLFELYAEGNEMWNRLLALNTNYPSRYNNRGGSLLKEEKERKFLARKLVKIKEEILLLAKEYETQAHKPFLAYGENILLVIARDWKSKALVKPISYSARASTSSKWSATTFERTSISARAPKVVDNLNQFKLRNSLATPRTLAPADSKLHTPFKLHCTSTIKQFYGISPPKIVPVKMQPFYLSSKKLSKTISNAENTQCHSSRLSTKNFVSTRPK